MCLLNPHLHQRSNITGRVPSLEESLIPPLQLACSRSSDGGILLPGSFLGFCTRFRSSVAHARDPTREPAGKLRKVVGKYVTNMGTVRRIARVQDLGSSLREQTYFRLSLLYKSRKNRMLSQAPWGEEAVSSSFTRSHVNSWPHLRLLTPGTCKSHYETRL